MGLIFAIGCVTLYKESISKKKAVTLAQNYANNQEWDEKYDFSNPSGVFETKNEWDVFFRKVRFSGKPKECLIQIDKKTGLSSRFKINKKVLFPREFPTCKGGGDSSHKSFELHRNWRGRMSGRGFEPGR